MKTDPKSNCDGRPRGASPFRVIPGETFPNECHPDLNVDYVLANPSFNDSYWRGGQSATLARERLAWTTAT